MREWIENFKNSPAEMSPEAKSELKSAILKYLENRGPECAEAIKNCSIPSGVQDDDFLAILAEMVSDGVLEARYLNGMLKLYYVV